MRKLYVALIAAPLLMASAPLAAHAEERCKTRPDESAAALRDTALEPTAAAVIARSALACGRSWTAANLLERANTDRSGPLDRFNLATAYARTGRYEAARALYQSAAADGAFKRGQMGGDPRTAEGRTEVVSLAEEANKRIALLDGLIAGQAAAAVSAQTVATNAVAVTGTDASATVPSATPAVVQTATPAARIAALIAAGHVSDDVAIQRDGLQ